MPDSYHTIEARIQEAIQSLHEGKSRSIRAAARQFIVPENRLRHRYNGRLSKSAIGGRNKKLSDAQDSALINYIDHLNRSGGQHITRETLDTAANRLLAQSHIGKGPPPTVSAAWARRWLQRHPDIRVEKQRPLAAERKEGHTPEEIRVPTIERSSTPLPAFESTYDANLFTIQTTTHTLQQQFAALQPGTSLYADPKSWQLTLSNFMKGCMALIATGELAGNDLNERQKVDRDRTPRNSGGSRAVQRGG